MLSASYLPGRFRSLAVSSVVPVDVHDEVSVHNFPHIQIDT